MPPATMLQRNLNEFEDLDDMERVRGIQLHFELSFAATYSCRYLRWAESGFLCEGFALLRCQPKVRPGKG